MRKIERFVCEMCGTEYADKLIAAKCENCHKKPAWSGWGDSCTSKSGKGVKKMNLKCPMGKHEPVGENLLAFAFGEESEDAWLRKCKYCDKYIALSKGNRRIITEPEAKAIVRVMGKAHAAVKIMTKIIAEVMSDGKNKSDHLSD